MAARWHRSSSTRRHSALACCNRLHRGGEVLFILRNARLDAPWEQVPRKTLSIVSRAIDSLTTTQGVGDLYRIFAASQRDGVDFNLAYIPSSFRPHPEHQFETPYMRELFAFGKNAAARGYDWHKHPPGYERPDK